MRSPRRLVLLLAIFATLNAIVWSLMVPPGNAPDEQAHFKLASYIGQELEIPEFGETEGFGVEVIDISPGSDAHIIYTYSSYAAQPPLPYLLAAPWIQLPTDSVWMDYHQARVAQALLVGLLVLASAALAHRMFPSERLAPITVAAVVGLWPQVTYLGAYLNADALATLASAAIAWGWFHGATNRWDRRSTVVMGLLMGLGVLAKLNVWVLVALTAVVALMTLQGRLKHRLGTAAIAGGTALLVVSPWLIWALSRYGLDVLAQGRQSRMAAKFDATPLDAASSNWSYLHMLFEGHWIENVSKTFVIGIPGRLPELAEWGFPLALVTIGMLGCFVWLVRNARAIPTLLRDPARRPHLIAVLLLPLLFGLASRNAFLHDIYFLGQGRYLFPALAPLLTYAVVGCLWLVPSGRARVVMTGIIMLGAGATNAVVLWKGIGAVYGNSLPSYTGSWQVVILGAWVLAAVAAFVACLLFAVREFRGSGSAGSPTMMLPKAPVTQP